MLNSAINKLPFEIHIPGYRFCGPGTKLKERLARGDRGINGLDEACKKHDIAYSQSKQLEDRHEADKILAQQALSQFRSKNSSWTEKMAALGVAGAMKAKVKLGMGLKINNYRSMVKKCVRELKKIKTSVERNLDTINYCITILTNNNDISSSGSSRTSTKSRKKTTTTQIKKLKKSPKKKSRNMNMDIDISDDYPMTSAPAPPSPPPPQQTSTRKKIKRKLEGNGDEYLINKRSKTNDESPSTSASDRKRKRDLLEDTDDADVNLEEEYKKKTKTQ